MDENTLRRLDQAIRPEALRAHSMHIAEIERTFSYDRFAESSAYCEEQFRQVGLRDVRRTALPADGVTTYMDFTMPQAWDVEGAALEIVSPVDKPIPLLDYAAMPLSLANRCAPTPPEGIVAPVVTAQQMHDRESVAGAYVYTQGQHPGGLRFEATAKGALGFISDTSPARQVAPGETYWLNGWCSPGWYETKENKPLTCFSITPLQGAVLADLLTKGEVHVRALVRTRIYDGSIYTVSGLLPGQEEREIVLLAHIYEPFPSDDAVGAAALIEIARALGQMDTPPRLGVRLVVSMERYGFAEYWAREKARCRALLAVSMDAISLNPVKMGAPIEVRSSAKSLPFWGDWLLRAMADARLAHRPVEHAWGNLSDDTFPSDRTIGVPMQWVWTRVGPYHHSSAWLHDEMNDWDVGAEIARLIGAYTATLAWADPQDAAGFVALARARMAAELDEAIAGWRNALQAGALTTEQARQQAAYALEWQQERINSFARMFPGADTQLLTEQLAQFARGPIASLAESAPARELSAIQQEARRLVAARATLGMPFSQARVPLAERLGGNYEQPLNWVDGRRDLLEVADRYAWEEGKPLDDAWLSRLLQYVRLMARYGYLTLEERKQN